MKRLNRKKKLIVATAITLIVIILAIVITTNIISNNSQIASEGYFATTANANSKLVASYIRQGITIGGITGTFEVLDTSDATATAEEISWKKTAYVNGKKITGTYVPPYNYTFTDSLGNEVEVPGGFGVVNPEDNVPDGIIIEDVKAGDGNTKGSQFVWIPVGDVITDTNGSTTKIELGRYTFSSTGEATIVQSSDNWRQGVGIATFWKELEASSYGNVTAKNLEEFITKATTSGGYYIGRYEAGDATATNTARTSNTNDSNPITCKTGVYPYNYVTQSQASNLSRGMYSSSNFDSDLINSYAWDTAIVFIQKFSGDTDYSRQIRLQSTFAKCGEATDGTNNDVKCNIYDMAGNVYEWTTETFTNIDTPCVARGGGYNSTINYSSNRGGSNKTDSDIGSCFRPILYL